MRLDIEQRKEGILGEVDGDFPMDEAVISVLPRDSRVLSAESYADTAWTQTGRINIELSNGDTKQYFIKVALGDVGRQLVRGEHTAIALINELIPGLVPKPLAWGEYNFSPNTYFFIEDFHDMDMSLPNPTRLARRLLQFHRQFSPNGMFGFPVSTFDDIAPHPHGWEKSWTVFFTRLLRKSVESDAETNGVWPELSMAAEQLLTVVAPRLLNPLQEVPDSIVPLLIHGDLWGGNVGKDEETGELIFVDAGSFYAHNEMEIGMWRRYGVQNLGQTYLEEYKRFFPPSEPQEEFDDRNRLYSMKFDLNMSAGNPGDKARNVALNNMIYLCEKYSPLEGLPKYDPRKDPSAGMGYIYAEKQNGRMQ